MNTARNAVIYARYSCDKQTEQSIEGQLRVVKEFAEREGYIIVGEYIDRAKSAKTANRPEFLRMISDSKKRNFQYVLVYKLDRFSRNRYDSAFYKQKLKENGVTVVSATELLSDNPESIITEAILEAMAEFYSAELSQKTKRGMRESAMKCQTTGAQPPFGYKWGEDKKLHIDSATSAIPLTAFRMYADGKGKAEIAKELNRMGYRTKKGRLFTISTLENMLSNKKYIGIYTYMDIEVEGGCPALIDVDTFNRVQELLRKTKKAPARARAKVEYLLSGKLFCGYCGEKMIATGGTSRNGEQHHYYRCKTGKDCAKKGERKDYLEWLICQHVVDLLNMEGRKEILADKVIEAYRISMETDKVSEYEKQLKSVTERLNHVVDLLIDHKTDALIEKMENLELQKSEIEEQLYSARLSARHIPTRSEIIEWFEKFKAVDELKQSMHRQVINTFVHKVFLYNDKVVIIFTLSNTQETIGIEEIRDFEAMLEENEEPLSDNSESGSCRSNTVYVE